MDVDECGSSTVGIEAASVPPRRSNAIYHFTQQSLPACKPVLTPVWVIATFFLMGIIFIPVGLVSLHASQSVVEIVDRYDTDCIPKAFKSNKVAYIKDSSMPKNCSRFLKVVVYLDVDDVVAVTLLNNYNTYSFGGKKKLVLSTSSWLGGKNDFLGMAYLSVGSSSILISLVFLLIHVKNPRPYGDTTYLSWNWKGISS
ncbi:ALA-interacting subunit like [Actinidia chinensis var. chinensis]|uniref:ALA-interacting subunit like n=1 Tax=Actinidia chinensis var. chinensis TaxID=1590841 RepID=A0A2R6Q5T6_ACTCC|nr:ALA-interacting subunit like [Actinidia chinensis var. chinensis]